MILDILMRDLGLGKVCLQQESLSATFGAGYGVACVVDIGAQKTSICCVDEGLKQKFCSMDEGSVTVQTWDFHLRASGQDTRKYTFKTYDETMLSVMVSHYMFLNYRLC